MTDQLKGPRLFGVRHLFVREVSWPLITIGDGSHGDLSGLDG